MNNKEPCKHLEGYIILQTGKGRVKIVKFCPFCGERVSPFSNPPKKNDKKLGERK